MKLVNTSRDITISIIAILISVFCLNARVNAMVIATDYRCLGAFQPKGPPSWLGQPDDLWRDAQGVFHIFEADYIQTYDSQGQYLQAVSLKAPENRWFGVFDRVVTDQSGNIYGVDTSRCQIVVFGPDGQFIRSFGTRGDGDGELYFPTDAAIDVQGNLIVIDTNNHRLTVWTTSGHWLRAISLPALVYDPSRLKIDARGHIFIMGHGIYELDAQGKYLRTVIPAQHKLGDGGLSGPMALALGQDGCIYVVEYTLGGCRIAKFSPQGKQITFIGVRKGVIFDRIHGLWVDRQGIVYGADHDNQRILVFAPTARPEEKLLAAQAALAPLVPVLPPLRVSKLEYVFERTFDGNQELNAWVRSPKDVILAPAGDVYVSGRGGVTQFTADGVFVKNYPEPPLTVALPPCIRLTKMIPERTQMNPAHARSDIESIALDKHGNLFAVYSIPPEIVRWNVDGSPPTVLALAKRNDHQVLPLGIAVDSQDRLYITDYARNEIDRYDEEGNFIDLFGPSRQNPFWEIAGIAIDLNDNVLVTQRGGLVTKLNADGTIAWAIGKDGRQFGEFRHPYRVATDNTGNIFVADSDNGRIQKFGTDGTFLTAFGELSLDPDPKMNAEKILGNPMGVAVSADGHVYVANFSRVTVFRPLPSPFIEK